MRSGESSDDNGDRQNDEGRGPQGGAGRRHSAWITAISMATLIPERAAAASGSVPHRW